MMISNVISVGNKVELQSVKLQPGEEGDGKQIYTTEVYDLLSEERLELLMPMEKTKLILLPVGEEYDVVFYGQSGLYQCFAKVVDRYKSGSVYILVLELSSNLRRHQRRAYYRFSCALDMRSRTLEEEEVQAVEQKAVYDLTPGLPLKRSIIADISGGGLRFLSDQRYEPEQLIYCSYQLLNGGKNKLYEVVGKILAVRELDKRPGIFEHRVQYVNLDPATREEIIKFIFEEERKTRKRERMSE